MGSIRARPQTGKLFFDFRYRGERCREQTALDDTPANRRKARQVLERIEAEITLGTFDYARYFPNSAQATQLAQKAQEAAGHTPRLRDFADIWFEEMKVQWRKTHQETVYLTLKKYILPEFGDKEMGLITKAHLLEFRSTLAKVTSRKGKPLSTTRINHVMLPLRMMLNEAANRYDFVSPYHGIKSLKVPRSDVAPFTVDEVKRILQTVRADFRTYYTVRFFTGLRTGEIDGLQWQYVDFERRQILVRHAWVKGAIAGVMAVFVGLLATVVLSLGRLVLPIPAALVLSAAAFVAVRVFKWNLPATFAVGLGAWGAFMVLGGSL